MKFDPRVHGRGSADGGVQAVVEAWASARTLPEGDGEWVPVQSIWIKDGIGPRGVNHDTVRQYAACFEALPPIEVQRDTFALIDGRHRLMATGDAIRDHIRIREVDISDDDLAERAFLANLNHGLPYALAERVQGLKLLLGRHPDWSNGALARLLALSHETVAKYRGQIQKRQSHDEHDELQPSENRIVDRRIGADGRTRQVSENRTPARAPVRSYDPGPEAAPHDDRVSDTVSSHTEPSYRMMVPAPGVNAPRVDREWSYAAGPFKGGLVCGAAPTTEDVEALSAAFNAWLRGLW